MALPDPPSQDGTGKHRKRRRSRRHWRRDLLVQRLVLIAAAIELVVAVMDWLSQF
jgi:F0F1-type ATP synthase assembly protein I